MSVKGADVAGMVGLCDVGSIELKLLVAIVCEWAWVSRRGGSLPYVAAA